MLPKLVEPRRLAEQRVTLQGQLAIADMPRVAEVAQSSETRAQVEFCFFRDEDQRIRVTGHVKGCIDLICQRCLEPVNTEFDQSVELVAVWGDDQSKAVPREFDPWEVGEQANLYELIEDEILLALPVVVMHPPGACQAPFFSQAEEILEQKEGRQRPFDILRDLTKSSD